MLLYIRLIVRTYFNVWLQPTTVGGESSENYQHAFFFFLPLRVKSSSGNISITISEYISLMEDGVPI